MKILQLCKKFPFPTKDGESIAITYLSKAMHDLGHEVSLLSMNTKKHYTDINSIPPSFNHYKEVHTVDIDNSIKIVDAFKNFFTNESYHVSRYIDEGFEQKLVDLLQKSQYDVIQLETLYLAPYVDIIKQHSTALVTMRAHNVEFEIWERLAENTKFLPKKLYLNYLTKKLKKYEIDNLNSYDYLIPVSGKDLVKFKKLGYMNGAMASPIGLETNRYIGTPIQTKKDGSLKICFIGALDWMPNLEGFEWFVSEVWDSVSEKIDVELYVAGRNTPESLRKLQKPNVHVLGEIDDAIAFISSCDIMIVPLFSGSGTRVKILEGMALGKTIVTTSIGLEGIEAEHDKEVLVGNTVEDFVHSIERCAQDPTLVEQIGSNARQFVKDYYDNKANAETLLSTYQKLLASPEYQK